MDITYCTHTDCVNDCARHQNNAPKDIVISIADLDDGLCYTPVTPATTSERDKLREAICNGTQYTCHKCDEHCRSWCGNDGTCDYCGRIADAIEAAFRSVR